VRSVLIASVLAAVAACQSSGTTTSSAPPASQTAAVGTSVGTVPAAASAGVAAVSSAAPGSPVDVVALYLGWKGPCMGSPPTRSAWMLADGEQKGAPCLYVDGPEVPGVSPEAALGKNIRVHVVGVLREERGRKFIEAQRVERQ
jgi:hypothetical protein